MNELDFGILDNIGLRGRVAVVPGKETFYTGKGEGGGGAEASRENKPRSPMVHTSRNLH